MIRRLKVVRQALKEVAENASGPRRKISRAPCSSASTRPASGSSLTTSACIKEVAFFADRSDVSEELTRLESHLAQFAHHLRKDEPVGRTLEFITQEISRELNTLGAKAGDAEISRHVVACKAEVEKIREQIQNLE